MGNDLYNEHKPDQNKKRYFRWGRRHIIIIHLFFAFAVSFAQKINLSVGIVSMLDNSHNSAFLKYNWTEEQRGWILSSLFWGYAITPLPGGIICQRYGARLALFIVIFTASVFTIFTQQIANLGWIYLCLSRFIIGLAQGVLYPSVYSLLPKWTHPSERAFLSSMVFAGSKMGMVLTLSTSGLLAASPVLGWPSIFYFTGGAGLLLSISWIIFGDESPDVCKKISSEECEYIKSGIKVDTKQAVPWKGIFTSIPFWSLFVTSFTSSFLFFLLLTEIPTYLNGVLRFSIRANAVLSALPYFCMFLSSIGLSYISDFLTNRKYCSTNFARKSCNTLATWIPSILLIVLGYTTENIPAAVTLLIILVSLNCGTNIGYLINHMDLSPNFSGTLVGITGMAQSVASMLGPLLVGYVVYDTKNDALWRIVFFVTAVIASFGNLIFILFGSTKLQKWNSNDLDIKNRSNENNVNGSINEVNKIEA